MNNSFSSLRSYNSYELLEFNHSILINKISGVSNTFCGELYIPKTELESTSLSDMITEIAERDLINTRFTHPSM